MNVLLRSVSTLALATAALAASAAPITYTITGVGTGTLDGTAFTGQSYTIVAQGDTSAIVPIPFGYSLLATSATVTAGGLTDTFSDIIRVTADNVSSNGPFAGFGDDTKGTAFLFVNNAAFTNYNLASAIGPIAGDTVSSFPQNSFATSRGSFSFSSVRTGSFTANPTPEPSALAALGLGAVAVLRRRKRA